MGGLLPITVNGCINAQTDGLNERRLCQTEIRAFHPVVVVFIKRILVDMSQRNIILVVLRSSGYTYRMLTLWSPVIQH